MEQTYFSFDGYYLTGDNARYGGKAGGRCASIRVWDCQNPLTDSYSNPAPTFSLFLPQAGRRRLLLDHGPRRRRGHCLGTQSRNSRGRIIAGTPLFLSIPPSHPFSLLIPYLLSPPPLGPASSRGRGSSRRDPARRQGQLSLLLRDSQSRRRTQPRVGDPAQNTGTCPLVSSTPCFAPFFLRLLLKLYS